MNQIKAHEYSGRTGRSLKPHSQSPLDAESIATALVQRYEPEFSDPFVSVILNGWVEEDPDRAVDWLVANRGDVNPAVVTTMVWVANCHLKNPQIGLPSMKLE